MSRSFFIFLQKFRISDKSQFENNQFKTLWMILSPTISHPLPLTISLIFFVSIYLCSFSVRLCKCDSPTTTAQLEIGCRGDNISVDRASQSPLKIKYKGGRKVRKYFCVIVCVLIYFFDLITKLNYVKKTFLCKLN